MEKSEELDLALAKLISSTRTKKRPASIVEICDAAHTAAAELGSLSAVADRIGLSEKMLRQFTTVELLIPEVRGFVLERQIDSVDAVSHLSKMKASDQSCAAKKLIDKSWNTSDVRAFLELRKLQPNSSTPILAKKIESSKVSKEYAFEFVRRGSINEKQIKQLIEKRLGASSIKGVKTSGSRALVVLTSEGYSKLREISKEESVPLKDIIPYIVY